MYSCEYKTKGYIMNEVIRVFKDVYPHIIGIIVTIYFLLYMFGAFAYTEGYTVERDVTPDDVPASNVYYEVKEIRKYGVDRVIFASFDFDKAYEKLEMIKNLAD